MKNLFFAAMLANLSVGVVYADSMHSPASANPTSAGYQQPGTYNTSHTNANHASSGYSNSTLHNQEDPSQNYSNPTGTYHSQGNNYRGQSQAAYQDPTSSPHSTSDGTSHNHSTHDGTSSHNAYPNEKKYPKDQYKTQFDRELNKKIRANTDGWFTDSYKGIILRTSDGLVIIEGVVSSPDDQKKLNEEVKKIEGVKSIQNVTTINKEQAHNTANSKYGMASNQTYATNQTAPHAVEADSTFTNEKKHPGDQYKTQNDRLLNKKIRDQITGWFTDNYKEIIIKTADGVVVVEGFALSLDDHTKLNNEINKVEGVKSVKNNSQVKKQAN